MSRADEILDKRTPEPGPVEPEVDEPVTIDNDTQVVELKPSTQDKNDWPSWTEDL